MAKRLIPLILLAALAAITIAPRASAATALPAARPAIPAHTTRTITLGMGYVPSVQFAPFYVADQRGYYRRAGIAVNFSYAASPNLLQLVGSGKVDLAIADGTDAIAAEASGIPITYVMAQYQRFPIAIFSLAKKGIHSVTDLRGKTVGVPGKYGATYVGLLAALHSAGLRASDVHIVSIGYTQVESVAGDKVDAAVGYSNNEPLQLQQRGYKINTIEVSDVANLVGAGIVAGQSLIRHDPALVRAFVQATLHGMADTIADPHAAFAAALRVHGLDTLRGADARAQYAVLLRTIDLWHDAATRVHGLGYADPKQWQDSMHILHAIGQLTTTPNAAALYTNRFSSGARKE